MIQNSLTLFVIGAVCIISSLISYFIFNSSGVAISFGITACIAITIAIMEMKDKDD